MAPKNQNQSLGFADDNRHTKPVPFLSKSKLLAYRQCSRRLWLEVNHADAKVDSSATQASFRMGHQVGDIARHLYDPTGCGHLIDINKDGFEKALSQSQHWLQQADAPVFEMGFRAAGVLAFADVMLPVQTEGDMPTRRINRLMRLGRTLPDLPADLLFEVDEWRAAFILNKKPPPKIFPTANTVIRLIAKLGGFWAERAMMSQGPKHSGWVCGRTSPSLSGVHVAPVNSNWRDDLCKKRCNLIAF